MSPAARLSMRWARGERRNQLPITPASRLKLPNTRTVAAIKIRPSTPIYTGRGPRAGSVNCGRKARKKIDTLGLVTFMTMPRR